MSDVKIWLDTLQVKPVCDLTQVRAESLPIFINEHNKLELAGEVGGVRLLIEQINEPVGLKMAAEKKKT